MSELSAFECLFSIVIPTFNRKSSLNRCLDSLSKQTFKNFEVIVCDDGSTDGSDTVVSSYSGLINIKYLWNENWGGPARPRNIGLIEAKGKWVCFLDSDDWYHEERLLVLSRVVSAEYDVYHHKLISVDSKGQEGKLSTRQIDNKNAAIDLLTCFNGILTSSTCINREKLLLSGVVFSENKAIVGLEDFDCWINLALKGFKFKFVNHNLGYYEVGGNDHISLLDRRQIDRFTILYNSYQSVLTEQEAIKSQAAFNYQKACLLMNGDFKEEGLNAFIFALKNGSYGVRLKAIYKIIRFYI